LPGDYVRADVIAHAVGPRSDIQVAAHPGVNAPVALPPAIRSPSTVTSACVPVMTSSRSKRAGAARRRTDEVRIAHLLC